MPQYEVVNIDRDETNLRVMIEHSNGRREQFVFPLAQGWEEEDANGELRCIKYIKNLLKERAKQISKASNIDMENIRSKHLGRVINTDED